MLLSIPHGGTVTPPELATVVRLSEPDRFDDSDPYTQEIYDLGSAVTKVITSDVARAFVDLNRAPDDLPPDNPDGVVKSVTCYGKPIYEFTGDVAVEEGVPAHIREVLLERYYYPYHREITESLKRTDVAVGLDCHSMASWPPLSAPDPSNQRPLFCLSNADGQTCPVDLMKNLARAIAEHFEVAPDSVWLNRPFKGGFITRHHGSGDVPWIQVEMNRSLYLDEEWFDRETRTVAPHRLAELRERFRESLKAFARDL